MKRVNVDTAPPAVRKFLRTLRLDPSGVEISLEGEVVCKIIPPSQLSDGEKAAQLTEVRGLLQAARQRSKLVAPAVVDREIREAIKAVRGAQ